MSETTHRFCLFLVSFVKHNCNIANTHTQDEIIIYNDKKAANRPPRSSSQATTPHHTVLF